MNRAVTVTCGPSRLTYDTALLESRTARSISVPSSVPSAAARVNRYFDSDTTCSMSSLAWSS